MMIALRASRARVRVYLPPAVLSAHRDQLSLLPNRRLQLRVGKGTFDDGTVAEVERLGPIAVTVELSGRLDAARSAALAHLKDGELLFEPDGGTILPDELERLRGL